MRALIDQAAGAIGSADASADAAAGSGGEQFHQRAVFAVAHRGVEIDDLNLREGREFAQHLQRRVAFQGLIAALHKLDDFAVHQIDARQNHLRTGTPRAARNCFRSPTVYVP